MKHLRCPICRHRTVNLAPNEPHSWCKVRAPLKTARLRLLEAPPLQNEREPAPTLPGHWNRGLK